MKSKKIIYLLLPIVTLALGIFIGVNLTSTINISTSNTPNLYLKNYNSKYNIHSYSAITKNCEIEVINKRTTQTSYLTLDENTQRIVLINKNNNTKTTIKLIDKNGTDLNNNISNLINTYNYFDKDTYSYINKYKYSYLFLNEDHELYRIVPTTKNKITNTYTIEEDDNYTYKIELVLKNIKKILDPQNFPNALTNTITTSNTYKTPNLYFLTKSGKIINIKNEEYRKYQTSITTKKHTYYFYKEGYASLNEESKIYTTSKKRIKFKYIFNNIFITKENKIYRLSSSSLVYLGKLNKLSYESNKKIAITYTYKTKTKKEKTINTTSNFLWTN